MSRYILRALTKALERPTRAEVLEQIRRQPLRKLSRAPADIIREGRGER